MDESQQETPLIISTETPSTTEPKRSKRSAKPATTKRQEPKLASVAEIMKAQGMTWGVHEGRRVLNIPSRATEEGRRLVYEAIKREQG